MKIPFKHYLHESYTTNELSEWVYSQIKDTYTGTEEDLRELITENGGSPFYEVGFNCELDTVTGKMEILSVIK